MAAKVGREDYAEENNVYEALLCREPRFPTAPGLILAKNPFPEEISEQQKEEHSANEEGDHGLGFTFVFREPDGCANKRTNQQKKKNNFEEDGENSGNKRIKSGSEMY